ncbi:gamma carbonic anhydrase family protein, partial [Neisseria sp. P0015.S010]
MANPIRAFLDYVPSVDESCFVDETSVVIGEVSLAEDVSIW